MTVIQKWWQRTLSNPQVVMLVTLLVVGLLLVNYATDFIAPILASIVIAYMLDGGIVFFERRQLPRGISLAVVYILFLVIVALLIFYIIPILSQQIGLFLNDLPQTIQRGRELLLKLPDTYPEFISEASISNFIDGLRAQIVDIADGLLQLTVASVTGFISVMIYLILVPLLVFFWLKDKEAIFEWIKQFLPKSESRELTYTVWGDFNKGISGYIRGKLIEIVIMWVVHWIVFALLGLKYAPLLSFLVGLSVIIPYLGAAVVTIPIALVGYGQWGFSEQFLYLMVAFAILQFIDGNLLVPLLFSEIVNIHPIAIICSVLVFGHIWGIWGVFFAIPLATAVNAILKAWPRGMPE